MPVFNIIVQQDAISTYEKEVEVEAYTLEEALEIAKEEADNGYWEGWNEVGDPIVRIHAYERDE